MLNEGNSKKLSLALARKPDVVPLSPIGDLVFLYVQMPFQISILFFGMIIFAIVLRGNAGPV